MNIGEAIKILRKNDNYTQGELSNDIGITQPYLSGIENGRKTPSLEILEKISVIMGTPLPVLFWFGVEKEDVPEEKQYIYDTLKPSIDKLMMEVFT